jgi:ABC-type transport system substrate-binding protein
LPEGELKPLVTRDVEAARRLLAEAGFPNGQNFPKVRILAPTKFPEWVATARMFSENLREIGLDLEVVAMEWGAYSALVSKGDAELGFGVSTFYPDPDLYLWPQAHSKSANGTRGYRHAGQEELDRLLDQARSWTGPREGRRDLIRRIDKMVLEDPPLLVLYTKATLEGVSTRLKGYTPSYTGRRAGFRGVSIA